VQEYIAQIISMLIYSFYGRPHQRARVDKKCVKDEMHRARNFFNWPEIFNENGKDRKSRFLNHPHQTAET
jgi:hypothetical protein